MNKTLNIQTTAPFTDEGEVSSDGSSEGRKMTRRSFE